MSTRVRFLLGVSSEMHRELFSASEGFVTMLTSVWPVPSVCPHVDHELATLNESLATDIALVRPLSRVDSQVAVKFARVLK